MADNIERAAIRASICADMIADLSERSRLTGAEYNLLAEQRAVLERAGQLHRIDGGA